MPTQHTVTSYKFDELSDDAKEAARDWYRAAAVDLGWWESTYEDAARIGLKITGFDLGRAQSIQGEFVLSPEDIASAIMREHSKDCETYKLADEYMSGKQTDDDADEFARAIKEEYWHILEKEAEYLTSDECVDESIRVNDYDFTESGKRWR